MADNPSEDAPDDVKELTKESVPSKTDPFLDKAVDEIVHGESDQLLKAKDEELEHAFEPKKTRWEQIKQRISDIWSVPKYRYTFMGSVVTLLVVLMVVPVSRWGIMNTLGFRASAVLKITDDKTTQPIKNATVTLRGKSAKTDENGAVKIEKIKLGPAKLVVQKTAYTDVSQTVRVGLGSNDLGGRTLSAVGARLKFKAIDWLSKQPIKKAEATIGESSAFANDEGLIELPIEPTDSSLEVSIDADKYIASSVDTSVAESDVKEVALVTDYPNYFVSNRNGKYELYSVQADGNEEKLILAATGRESAFEMQLSMSPDRTSAAFISKRDNEKNTDGYILDSLNVFDMKTNLARRVTTSERVYLVGWDGTKVLYVKVAAGTSAGNAGRERLMSYDTATNQDRELASSNYFLGAAVIKNYVYYTQGDNYSGAKKGVQRSKTDGSDRLTIFGEVTWGVYRSDWDTFIIQAPSGWRKYSTNKSIEKLDSPPANLKSINFVDNADASKTVWFEERDGKGTILLRDTNSKDDKVIRQQSGLASIVGWAGDKYIVYRVATQSETADYILNIDGGEPAKIKDVFNVSSIRQRY